MHPGEVQRLHTDATNDLLPYLLDPENSFLAKKTKLEAYVNDFTLAYAEAVKECKALEDKAEALPSDSKMCKNGSTVEDVKTSSAYLAKWTIGYWTARKDKRGADEFLYSRELRRTYIANQTHPR